MNTMETNLNIEKYSPLIQEKDQTTRQNWTFISLDIYDFGQQKQVPYPSGDISRSHQKGFGISVADVQKLCLDTKIVFSKIIFMY